MVKRGHFFPLLLASSPLVVTSVAVDTEHHTTTTQDVHHLRQPQQGRLVNSDDMKNTQRQTTSLLKQSHRQQHRRSRRLGKSTKSQRAKNSSKQSRDDGYHHYTNYDDEYSVVSGGLLSDNVSGGLSDNENGSEANKDEEGDDDVAAAPKDQAELSFIPFDIIFGTNTEDSTSPGMDEDGNIIKGEGSEAEAGDSLLYYDRGEGGSATTLGSDTSSSSSTTPIDQVVLSTSSPKEKDGSSNIDVVKIGQSQLKGRPIAGAGFISLVAVGTLVFLSAGLFAYMKQNKGGAVATNDNAEDAEGGDEDNDVASIWSANEEDNYIGDIGGGQAVPIIASPQPTRVSSIAAIGMSSPLALQLSGRNAIGAASTKNVAFD
jgi:hypothetical protein